jgi:EAL domain-containing protein (putative c-di-GMP-specific phosphodiesterase class I)
MSSTPTSILARLAREHFPRAKFSEPQHGIAVAHDESRRLTSAFQPIVRADGSGIAGHHALLRAAGDDGRAIEPADLFGEAGAGGSLEHLDRLARALHAVNYFARRNDGSRLFLTIDPRLLAAAGDDHRRYFDALLTSLDIPTSRVVAWLPDDALDDPVAFVRSAISYGIRGYRVAARLRLDDAHADLEHVYMADPHYVAIDATDFPPDEIARERLVRIVEALHDRGIKTLARRIEDGAHAQAARDAGFALLQGRFIAPPMLLPGA